MRTASRGSLPHTESPGHVATVAAPFTLETATQEPDRAEDGCNGRGPVRVALAYTSDRRCRNRSTFVQGRAQMEAFLNTDWQRELDDRLIKKPWAFRENRIAARFACEWHEDSGPRFRSDADESWAFVAEGLMHTRFASIDELPIADSERLHHRPAGRRPDDHPGLSESGL
jgi:nuclear transport factor 2 (NTF2) superfamily protein